MFKRGLCFTRPELHFNNITKPASHYKDPADACPQYVETQCEAIYHFL